MHDSAIQHYWKLVIGRLYHIIPRLSGHMHFAEGGIDVHQCHIAVPAVEQSVRRLVQQDFVCPVCGGEFFMLKEITSVH